MFHVEQSQFVEVLLEGSSILGIKLQTNQVAALTLYHRELQRWNQKINLTAIRKDKDIAVKHFIDSLVCGQALIRRDGASLLDVGSGAGFPGLPLKILDPRLSVTLLEPNEKKTSFLRHLIGTLDLKNVMVVSKNLGDYSRDSTHRSRFTYIATRALSAAQILPFATALLQPLGRMILCRTKPLTSDPGHGLTITSDIEYDLPYGFGHRVLTILEPMVSA